MALTGCKSVPPPTPLSELNPQQMQGHAVFQEHCSICHFDRIDKPGRGPALDGIFKKPYLPSGATADDERVLATIEHGRNMMPPMGGTMDQQDLEALMAYLHTL